MPYRKTDDIDRLARAFTDPLVVFDVGWADTLPEWIKHQITIERMGRLYKGGNDDYATDAEALAYLYCAGLSVPMNHDWTNIYLYLAGSYMQKRGNEVYEWIPKELSEYEHSELSELKYRIRQTQKKAVREKERIGRSQNRLEGVKVEQMNLFQLDNGGGSEGEA
jgi:hypothetical protein